MVNEPLVIDDPLQTGLCVLQRRISRADDNSTVRYSTTIPTQSPGSAMFKKFNDRLNSQEVALPLTAGVFRCPSTKHRRFGYSGDKIQINVSGRMFLTRVSTLERFPTTLLGDSSKREVYYDDTNKEIFLDRDRQCFEFILRFYQSGGILIKPAAIPDEVFYKELAFYQLDKFIQQAEEESPVETPAKRPKGRVKLMIWQLMEEPSSSIYAKIMSVVSVAVIFISIWNFCLETLPTSKQLMVDLCVNVSSVVVINNTANITEHICEYDLWSYPYFIVETFCVLYFTFEVGIRFVVSPEKFKFCKAPLNIIDVVSVIPYFVQIGFDLRADGKIGGNLGTSDESFSSLIVLRILRLVRILRIFKLSRYFTKLQVLGNTLVASVGELGILVFFIFIAMIVFSTVVYFCEANSGEGNKYDSIPAAFWWAVVTMTTVGYGDIIPRTVLGKIVGFLCAITGVLCIALPVPAIVNNFVKQMELMEKKNAAREKAKISEEIKHDDEINANMISFDSKHDELCEDNIKHLANGRNLIRQDEEIKMDDGA